MHGRVVLGIVAITLALALPAGAQGDGAATLTLVARESGCGDAVYCFDTNATTAPADVPVHVTVVNREHNGGRHSFYFDWTGDSDPGRTGSSASAADARVDALDPNATGHVTFTVPAAATRLYAWCGEAGHEALGMWHVLRVTQVGTGLADEGAASLADAPAPGVVAALTLTGLGAWCARRRRQR